MKIYNYESCFSYETTIQLILLLFYFKNLKLLWLAILFGLKAVEISYSVLKPFWIMLNLLLKILLEAKLTLYECLAESFVLKIKLTVAETVAEIVSLTDLLNTVLKQKIKKQTQTSFWFDLTQLKELEFSLARVASSTLFTAPMFLDNIFPHTNDPIDHLLWMGSHFWVFGCMKDYIP